MSQSTKWSAEQLLNAASFCWQSFTLQAAVKLDIFSALGDAFVSDAELAQKLAVNARALTMLLNALAAMGLLIKQGTTYRNAEAASRFLSQSSPDYLGHIIVHFYHTANAWMQLAESIKTGQPARTMTDKSDAERESFLLGMHTLASAAAPGVASLIDLSACARLLDLGGGPGTYAVHFCRANPHLSATVFDFPETKQYAMGIIRQFSLSERIDFIGGNFTADDIPGKYDAAWLSQILHGENPDSCLQLIKKTVASLNPGGKIFIHEFILDDTLDSPPFPAIFSLNMLVGTAHGQAYSELQLKEMLATAGVKDIQRILFTGPNDSGIISGTV